ncbi:MAG: RsmF rRNA methyltransferase first C-terminal domain-containing protein [Lachnospiraceae bacterium]|nr:RsmF rRNA methyltransferase first C-terminal domain-containing protein [Lachnospiraceae bacterium]
MELPVSYTNRMKELLGEEFPAFLESFSAEALHGLRTRGATPEELFPDWPDGLRPVPWAKRGYFYPEELQPGKRPLHEAGAYYIQEPSAQATATLLDPRPGERVLDLCAAPGGKTTQIAAAMEGRGILISNEIHPGRAGILSENVERMGYDNVIVTNESPARLAERFPLSFDRICVDAPCSGEGMFRKNPEAVKEWSQEAVYACAARQEEILEEAAKMLRPGGFLVYSTCTFAPEEDEGVIGSFLKNHPDFEAGDSTAVKEALRQCAAGAPEDAFDGRPAWGDGNPDLAKGVRIWPHHLPGEGHFAFLLHRTGDAPAQEGVLQTGCDPRLLKDYVEFARQTFAPESPLAVEAERLSRGGKQAEGYVLFGERLCRIPAGTPELRGLKVLRPGLVLGSFKKGRFEPDHALSHALRPEGVRRSVSLSDEDAARFLTGLTFPAAGESGWTLVCDGAAPLGWGKAAGGTLKNHYPRGLRK